MDAVAEVRKVHWRGRRARRRGAAIRAVRSLRRLARRRSRLERGLSTRRDWVRRALVSELLTAGPATAPSRRALNLHDLAERWGSDPRCLRRHIARWERMGWLKRINASGGRGKALIVDVNLKAFWSAAKPMRIANPKNPDISPDTPIQTRSASSADSRREGGSASPVNENSPKPDRSAIRLAWKHAETAERDVSDTSAERTRRALMRALRLICWKKGLSFLATQKLCSAVGRVLAGIGKAQKRRYLVAATGLWIGATKVDQVEAYALKYKPIMEFARHGFPAPARKTEAGESRQSIPGMGSRTLAPASVDQLKLPIVETPLSREAGLAALRAIRASLGRRK